jgi:hypothetical protein
MRERVISHWSFVIGIRTLWSSPTTTSFLFAFRIRRRLCHSRSDGFEVGIRTEWKPIHDFLNLLNSRLGNETSLVGPTKKMSGLVQRASRNSDKSPVVGIAPPTIALGNVRSYAVRSPDKLSADGIPRERAPRLGKLPDVIGKLFRHPVDSKFLQRCSGHICHRTHAH